MRKLDKRSRGAKMLISYQAKKLLNIEENFIDEDGRLNLDSIQQARKFAKWLNDHMSPDELEQKGVSASELYALSLLKSAVQKFIDSYETNQKINLPKKLLNELNTSLGEDRTEQALVSFINDFPPRSVERGEETAEEYLNKKRGERSNKESVLTDVLYFWLLKQNKAIEKYKELLSAEAEETNEFKKCQSKIVETLDTLPPIEENKRTVLRFLTAPFEQYPDSLEQQLLYILQNWKPILGELETELQKALDILREETMFRGPGPGEISLPSFEGLPEENYTPDRSWMPKLVLIAKNTYVWLDQLSKKYAREIKTLGDIPDEELKRLADWGITGLWLIGIWERSKASKRIKHLMGNIDAEASAYAVYDYQIAKQLGGEEGYQKLKDKANKYGLKLACDMVPNHTAIDAKWVYEHPDWFIQTDHPPYPSYTFNGENLSSREHIGIFLEDHYYTRTDAAVVFKWVDYRNGKTRYIYHGNDGTSMPWNDTAQLNYLLPEVREAVIQTIIEVAKKFPVIRFDAAMTLTKMHHQRLWWPKPGTGGAVPSRAEFSMSEEEFNKRMPKEFWREVVDRVNAKAPDTLLLAEAFWLLEGYFVRTLGMHRVYNSAFMHMLKNEENTKYRELIKKTLEFDPEILKRYVNFLSNPDEEVAVKQFGKGDKYFGVCLLLATMPGLPMIAHGQIEGFEEKYGMEYKRAYWDEKEDLDLIRRHEKEIFPLLKKRYLFAEVENFVLYDVVNVNNEVIEDVFAYSNKHGNEKALIIYHNKYKEVAGWIKNSVPFKIKKAEVKEEENIKTTTLAEQLELHNEEGYYVLFKDHITGLEYIRSSKELWEKGLYVELKAYKYHVFIDFKEVQDKEGAYKEIAEELQGKGTTNIEKIARTKVVDSQSEKSNSV